MDAFSKMIQKISLGLVIAGSICLVAVTVVIMANVFFRLLGNSILGVDEMVQLLAAPMIGFALGYTAIKHGHVIADLFVGRLSTKTKRVIGCITVFLGVISWGIVLWRGALAAWDSMILKEETTIIKWPEAPMRYVFTLGIAILFIALVLELVKTIREVNNK